MENQEFEVRGRFRIGREWQPFTRVFSAPNERQAKERAYTLFGSKHRLKRYQIIVDSVRKQQEEEL
ncbi:MAG: 50S ribosomal protein L18Ae [Methanoculleaceae archaeon]